MFINDVFKQVFKSNNKTYKQKLTNYGIFFNLYGSKYVDFNLIVVKFSL